MQDDDKIICFYSGTPKSAQSILPSEEKAFKLCCSESAATAQKNRQLLSTLEKHITTEPKCFNTLVEVIESIESSCSSSKETETAPHVSVIQTI